MRSVERRRQRRRRARSNDGPTSNAAVLEESASERLGLRLFVFGAAGPRAGSADDIVRRTNNANDHHQRHGNDEAPGISRRAFLKTTAGTAALLGAVQTQFPAGVHIAQAAGPEVTKAILGFIALTDAAPLFVAKEKGFFAKHGMPDVEVQKQASWGATRDNLVLGSEGNGIDGAHILTPMPYLITAGKVTQNNVPTPMYILARLNLDSQCISVAKEYADLQDRRSTPSRSRQRSRRRRPPARP